MIGGLTVDESWTVWVISWTWTCIPGARTHVKLLSPLITSAPFRDCMPVQRPWWPTSTHSWLQRSVPTYTHARSGNHQRIRVLSALWWSNAVRPAVTTGLAARDACEINRDALVWWGREFHYPGGKMDWQHWRPVWYGSGRAQHNC